MSSTYKNISEWAPFIQNTQSLSKLSKINVVKISEFSLGDWGGSHQIPYDIAS